MKLKETRPIFADLRKITKEEREEIRWEIRQRKKREKEASRDGCLPLVVPERGVGVATLFLESNHLVAPTGTGVRFRARYDFLHRRLSRNAIALTGTTCAWTVYSCSCRRVFVCVCVCLPKRSGLRRAAKSNRRTPVFIRVCVRWQIDIIYRYISYKRLSFFFSFLSVFHPRVASLGSTTRNNTNK